MDYGVSLNAAASRRGIGQQGERSNAFGCPGWLTKVPTPGQFRHFSPSFPPVSGGRAEPSGRSPGRPHIGGMGQILCSFRAVPSLWENRASLCHKPELATLEDSRDDGQSTGTNGHYTSGETTRRNRDTRTWRH